MPLILAIEPDRRQAARISSLARERLSVELIVMDSVEHALEALSKRTPDLMLTPQLLSPKDEAALNERLRQLDAAGSKVQTLVIPVLASTGRRAFSKGGLLNRLRRTKVEPATEGGCDPDVFAAQITEYLETAADERAAQAAIAEDERAYRVSEPDSPVVDAPSIEAPAEVVGAESRPLEFEFQQNADPERDEFELPQQNAEPEQYEVELQQNAEPEHYEIELQQSAQQDAEPEYVVPPSQVNREVPTDVLSSLSSELDELLESTQPIAAAQHAPSVTRVPADVHEPEAVAEEMAALAVPVAEEMSAFEEFVDFEELSVIESPTLAFGDLAAAMEHVDVEPIDLQAFAGEIDLQAFAEELEASATIGAVSVLDALEILDEPELPVDDDFQPYERRERRPALVAAREFDDETEPDPRSSDFDFDTDLWMPLPANTRRGWPTLEGPSVKAIFAHSFDAPPDPDVEFAPPASNSEDHGFGKKRKGSKPKQDEWGFFDPVQCGFAALLAKLDEVTDKDPG